MKTNQYVGLDRKSESFRVLDQRVDIFIPVYYTMKINCNYITLKISLRKCFICFIPFSYDIDSLFVNGHTINQNKTLKYVTTCFVLRF